MMTTRLTLLWLLLLPFSAPLRAQEPAAPLSDASPAPAEGAADVLPSYVWTTEAVTLKRWLESAGNTVSVEAGRRVEVLLQDGERVRVRSGTDFGWLLRAQVTATDPSAAGSDLSASGAGLSADPPEQE